MKMECEGSGGQVVCLVAVCFDLASGVLEALL